jgi:hypothetical protein
MPVLKGRRRVNPEEAKERKRMTRKQRKRKLGAIKKAHGLKRDCQYEAAFFILNPETGQMYTYRSTNDAVWAPWFEEIVSPLQQP